MALGFNNLFPNSALISATDGAARIFLPTTFCRGVIRTHVSRVAPDWDLLKTLYGLSYSAVVWALKNGLATFLLFFLVLETLT